MLNWRAGVPSAIHDHVDQHCWMLVLDGTLWIEDFARLEPVGARRARSALGRVTQRGEPVAGVYDDII